MVLTIGSSTLALAAEGSSVFQITASEKAACGADATRMCAHTYPDEVQLLGCMKANRSALGARCKLAFNNGLKRRHLD